MESNPTRWRPPQRAFGNHATNGGSTVSFGRAYLATPGLVRSAQRYVTRPGWPPLSMVKPLPLAVGAQLNDTPLRACEGRLNPAALVAPRAQPIPRPRENPCSRLQLRDVHRCPYASRPN